MYALKFMYLYYYILYILFNFIYIYMGKWIDCKIYTIDELKNTEFSEDDLHNLFDTKSLNLSLILHMFKLINDKRKDWEIVKMVRTESGWPDKYSMSRKLYNNFVKDLKEIFANVYQYRENTAKIKAEYWMTVYGFKYKD